MIGKWSICYSIDTLDRECNRPFDFYTFKANGTWQHDEVIIADEEIPVSGTWKLENGSLKIIYDKHSNFSFQPEKFPDIVFINDKLFYYKVLDNDEVKGHWIFFSPRRIE